MKNGANVVNLNEYKPVGTHWIPLDNSGKQFASFDANHIPKEIKRFIGHSNIVANIFRIQVYDLITFALNLLISCSMAKKFDIFY